MSIKGREREAVSPGRSARSSHPPLASASRERQCKDIRKNYRQGQEPGRAWETGLRANLLSERLHPQGCPPWSTPLREWIYRQTPNQREAPQVCCPAKSPQTSCSSPIWPRDLESRLLVPLLPRVGALQCLHTPKQRREANPHTEGSRLFVSAYAILSMLHVRFR